MSNVNRVHNQISFFPRDKDLQDFGMLRSRNQSKRRVAIPEQTNTASRPVCLPTSLHHRDAQRVPSLMRETHQPLVLGRRKGWQARHRKDDRREVAGTLCRMAEPESSCLLSSSSLWSKNGSCFLPPGAPKVRPQAWQQSHAAVCTAKC